MLQVLRLIEVLRLVVAVAVVVLANSLVSTDSKCARLVRLTNDYTPSSPVYCVLSLSEFIVGHF